MKPGLTIIRNARVLTMDARDSEHARADIVIEDGKIVAVAPDAARGFDTAAAQVIEAEGLLAMPGLINAHLHSPANLMKGALEGMPLEVFMLFEVPPMSEQPPPPRLHYVRTMLGAIEMLKLGITSVLDDAFYVPYPTPEAIDAVMQAYLDSGLRATATLDQPNVVEYTKYPFLEDLLPPDLKQRMERAPILPTSELVGLYQHLIARWNGAGDGRIGVGVSCSAPQRVTIDYFAELNRMSAEHDLPFVVHVLETKLQRVLGRERFGKSLVRYIHDLGFLDERMQIVHAIWVDDEDIALLAKAGCTVAHNPACNLKLGSGIMPFRRLSEAGVPICLGSDEMLADDGVNMWQVAKTAGLVHKITTPHYWQWPSSREILRSLFTGGARAMRRSDRIGQITPGYEADLILVDLTTTSFTPLNDLRRQLVYCESGASVVLTMVAGEVVVERGKMLTVDEDSLLREARALADTVRQDLEAAAAAATELEPYYREMYLRAAACDVGMNRWADP